MVWYLNAGLGELRECGQPLPRAHAGVVRFVEFRFQVIQLLRAERRAVAAEFR